MLKAPPFRYKSLSQQVRAAVREAILKGTLRSGERVFAGRIADELGVSRAPVREAFRQLEFEGLLKSEPQRGTFVAVPASVEVYLEELYSLRAVLEGLAARIVCRKPASELAELDAILERFRQAAAAEDEALTIEYDIQFHKKMCELSGHSLLNSTYANLHTQMRGLSEIILPTVIHRIHEVVAIHQSLLEALRQGDPDLAERSARQHITDTSERLLGYLRSSSREEGTTGWSFTESDHSEPTQG